MYSSAFPMRGEEVELVGLAVELEGGGVPGDNDCCEWDYNEVDCGVE